MLLIYKINKYDTGGASFVYPDGRDNYKLNVQDTIYKYVEDNTNGKRTQNLPEVSSVIVKDSKKDTYKIGDNSFEAYKINLEWSYVQDLGYDKTGEIILIKKDKNIYVVASQQNLHFQQWFKVIELMGYDWAKDCVHVPFGLVSMEDGTMSTRQGRVVFLEDVLNRAVEQTKQIILEKNDRYVL